MNDKVSRISHEKPAVFEEACLNMRPARWKFWLTSWLPSKAGWLTYKHPVILAKSSKTILFWWPRISWCNFDCLTNHIRPFDCFKYKTKQSRGKVLHKQPSNREDTDWIEFYFHVRTIMRHFQHGGTTKKCSSGGATQVTWAQIAEMSAVSWWMNSIHQNWAIKQGRWTFWIILLVLDVKWFPSF